MNIYNLRLPGGNQNFPGSELRDCTDKITGSLSTVGVAFTFKYLVTINASIVVVNEKHITTAKIIGEPAFEMAGSLVRSLIRLVQNHRLYSFVRERFLKEIFGCQLLVPHSTVVALHTCIFYPPAANNVLENKMKARSRLL